MQKAKKELDDHEKEKKKLAEDYLENNKKFNKVIETTKKMIRARETSNSIYSIQDSKNDKFKGQILSDANKIIKNLTDLRLIDPITVGLLKSEVYVKILKDKSKGIRELKMLMNEFPDNEEAYFMYWKAMKASGNLKELEDISIKLKTV